MWFCLLVWHQLVHFWNVFPCYFQYFHLVAVPFCSPLDKALKHNKFVSKWILTSCQLRRITSGQDQVWWSTYTVMYCTQCPEHKTKSDEIHAQQCIAHSTLNTRPSLMKYTHSDVLHTIPWTQDQVWWNTCTVMYCTQYPEHNTKSDEIHTQWCTAHNTLNTRPSLINTYTVMYCTQYPKPTRPSLINTYIMTYCTQCHEHKTKSDKYIHTDVLQTIP